MELNKLIVACATAVVVSSFGIAENIYGMIQSSSSLEIPSRDIGEVTPRDIEEFKTLMQRFVSFVDMQGRYILPFQCFFPRKEVAGKLRDIVLKYPVLATLAVAVEGRRDHVRLVPEFASRIGGTSSSILESDVCAKALVDIMRKNGGVATCDLIVTLTPFLRSSVSDIRQNAASVLDVIAHVNHALASNVVDALFSGSRDYDDTVYGNIVAILSGIALEYPTVAKQVVTGLFPLLNIVYISRLNDKKRNICLDGRRYAAGLDAGKLIRDCDDPRDTVVDALGAIAYKNHGVAKQVVDGLVNFLCDPYDKVRRYATRVIKTIVHENSALAESVTPALFSLLDNAYAQKLYKNESEIVSEHSHCHGSPKHEAGYNVGLFVQEQDRILSYIGTREAVISVLCSIACKNSGLAKLVVDKLKQLLEDPYEDVRKCAEGAMCIIEQAGQVERTS